jgi:hypothetical protein
VRTAKKIQKDMEKWAKMLNQKKESQKVAVAPPAVLPAPAAPHTQKGGHRVQVLLHNGGFCNTCTLKRCLLKMVDFRTNAPKNVHVQNKCFITNHDCYEKTALFYTFRSK